MTILQRIIFTAIAAAWFFFNWRLLFRPAWPELKKRERILCWILAILVATIALTAIWIPDEVRGWLRQFNSGPSN
jgi:hypothetical protein